MSEKEYGASIEKFERLSQFLAGEGTIDRSLAHNLFHRLSTHFGESLKFCASIHCSTAGASACSSHR